MWTLPPSDQADHDSEVRMLPQDIIRKKRDGEELRGDEIRSFISGATDGTVSEGQIGAFNMAVYLNGMTTPETVDLALAMRDSGRVLDWGPLGLDDRRLVDKHSSGGVGDEKITLLVVPMAAACGVHVPNLSGRGLDYCAGEVDMLDAVPGYQTSPEPERFMTAVRDVGGAIMGPTADLAPADRKLFYVRDVTATVESVPLITGSILSKKLASAPHGLVICVGSGSGAYMPTLAHAQELAGAMSEVAAGVGVPNVMLLTDLDSVLGTSVGNAVGVTETVDFLGGRLRDPRVLELVVTITAEMIMLAGLADDLETGREMALARLDDGEAAERFGRMIAALGGPADFMTDPSRYLPHAAVVQPVLAVESGFVASIDAGSIGRGLVALGGGRRFPDQVIDFSVGFSEISGVGAPVGEGRPLCVVHARDEADWAAAAARVRHAIVVADSVPPPSRPIVLERIASEAV
jgi:thymidine phosphorylase